MFLIAGAVLGYGALRRRGHEDAAKVTVDV
jgi:hypothetical protein